MIDRIVVINDLSQPKGGATGLALDSIRSFRSGGYPVTLLCGDEGANAELADLGTKIVGMGGHRLREGKGMRALATGIYNPAARAMIARWIAAHDTPGTVYHLHGWSQILSPAVFAALRPVRHRLVISAHDFFLGCPNGAFADLRTGAPCRRSPLSPSCLLANCDRRSRAEKAWRIARFAVQRHLYDPAHSPPVLAIHAAMQPLLRRAGIPGTAISVLPNPVVPYSTARIPAEVNRDVLFVGRLEETKGPDLAAEAARAPAHACA